MYHFFSSSFPFAVVLNRKEVKRERSCFEGSVRGTLFGCQTLYGESRPFSLAVKTGRISGEPFFFLFHFQIRKCCPRLLLVTRPITRTADGGEERKWATPTQKKKTKIGFPFPLFLFVLCQRHSSVSVKKNDFVLRSRPTESIYMKGCAWCNRRGLQSSSIF